MTGLNQKKTLGYVLSVFVRVYTPFIMMCGVFLQGVLELSCVQLSNSFYYSNSVTTGGSITVVLYIIATSKHLCKYHKACSYMLLLVMIEGLIYYYYPEAGYGNLILATTLTSFAGMICFLIFLICKHFTSRNRKHSQKAVSQTHQAL